MFLRKVFELGNKNLDISLHFDYFLKLCFETQAVRNDDKTWNIYLDIIMLGCYLSISLYTEHEVDLIK